MADTLKFRGGSTNDIVSSTVSDREIIFDTEKNTLVLGSAKDYLMRYGGNSQSGNVGIGVASPSTALDVSGTVTATAFVGTGTSTAASFIPTSSTVPTNGVYLPSANNVALATNGTGRLFIDSSGNVGIGTSSPSEILTLRSTGEPKIQIEDADLTNRIGQISQAGGAMIFRSRADTNNGQFVFRGYGGGSDTDFVTISTSGNVGIGTTSPYTDALLHISKANGGGNVDLRIQNSSTTTGTTTSLKFTNTTSDYAHVSLIANRDRELIFKNTNDTVETMRIDSSGRLLVGTSSARTDYFNNSLTAMLQVEGTNFGGAVDRACVSIVNNNNVTDNEAPVLVFGRSRGSTVNSKTLAGNGTRCGYISFQGADGSDMVEAASIAGEVDGTSGANDMPGRLVFSTTADGASSPTERMRIDNAGLTKFSTNGSSSYVYIHNSDTTAGNAISIIQGGTTNTSDTTTHLIRFQRNDGTEIGKIRRGGFSAVAYDTTSDYRLKSNVVPLTGAIDRVKSFNPIRFNWIDDTSDNPTVVDGFLAHEAQTVVPEAVSGFKDEVDDEGNAVIQGIDQSKLVPLLTAALQEAIAKIETLEQRLSDAGIA